MLQPFFSLIMTNSQVMVGNGKNVDFWCSNWTGSGPLLLRYAVSPSCFPCLDELWADGCWQWQSLGVQVSEQLKHEVQNSMICLSEKEDRLIWKLTDSGESNVKSAWEAVRASSVPVPVTSAYGVRPKDKEGMIGMEFLRALKLIFFPTGSLCDVVLSVWRTLLVSLVPAGFSGNICFFNAVVGVLMLLFCCLLSGCTVHVNCFAIAADCLFQLISVDVGISRFCSAAFLLCPSPLLTGIPAAFSYGVTAAFSDEFQLPLLSPFAAAFQASVHLITARISAAVQLD
ncbi:unnamed protein product [Ilex paraguariensis]|uniref:Uncharacterized protein n=1 Tax=Ilex paraguariensis TaxID=185542 RepID=A0ABC8SIY3_9AQUA